MLRNVFHKPSDFISVLITLFNEHTMFGPVITRKFVPSVAYLKHKRKNDMFIYCNSILLVYDTTLAGLFFYECVGILNILKGTFSF